MAKKVSETLRTETLEIVADKGYESRNDILNCVMNGVVPYVAMKYDKKERIYNIDYEEAEITGELRCSKKPEDIQKCLHAGVLPQCYEGTAISAELQMIINIHLTAMLGKMLYCLTNLTVISVFKI